MVTALPALPFPLSPPPAGNGGVSREMKADGAGGDVGGCVADVAFEVLLDATRILAAATHGPEGDQTSPSQMFEPNVGDAHDRRQMALKEEYRSSMARAGDVRPESAGNQGRRALPGGRTGGIQPASLAEGSQASGMAAGAGRSTTGPDAGRPGDAAIWSMFQSASARAGGCPVSSADVHEASAAGTSGSVYAALPVPSPTGASSADRAVVASIATTGTSNGSQVQTPAQQVAQLLCGGRGGELESLRAATSSPTATDTRSSDGDQRTSERPAATRQSQEGPSGQQATGVRGKSDAPQRSAFDQLVRSIRLNAGARQSSARLTLEPPELGRLHVNVRVQGDLVQINVRTETSAARDLVSERAGQLTAALHQYGISVERFEITTDWSGGSASAPDSHDVLDGEVSSDHEKGQEHEVAPSRANGPLPEDIDASLSWDVKSEPTAAGESRLDIRV